MAHADNYCAHGFYQHRIPALRDDGPCDDGRSCRRAGHAHERNAAAAFFPHRNHKISNCFSLLFPPTLTLSLPLPASPQTPNHQANKKFLLTMSPYLRQLHNSRLRPVRVINFRERLGQVLRLDEEAECLSLGSSSNGLLVDGVGQLFVGFFAVGAVGPAHCFGVAC